MTLFRTRLFGWIRIASGADGIGVPVFIVDGSNTLLVPETDSTLNIIRFTEFYNESGFEIRTFDKSTDSTIYHEGDPCPIPVWINQEATVVSGDLRSQDLAALWPSESRDSTVLKDLGRLLDEARSGVLVNRAHRWQASEIERRYWDIFESPPSSSGYWISRFKVALRHARSVAPSPHPIDISLGRTSREWLKRFAVKVTFQKLRSFVSSTDSYILTDKEKSDVFYGHCVHGLPTGDFNRIHAAVKDPDFFLELFPRGLYGYFLENGNPRNPFKYNSPPDFLESFRSYMIEADEKMRLRTARQVSFAFFGNDTSPHYISSVIRLLMSRHHQDFFYYQEEVRKFLARERSFHNYQETLRSALFHYDAMRDLDGIEHPDSRLTISRSNFGGISEEFISDLRRLVDQGAAEPPSDPFIPRRGRSRRASSSS